MKLIRTSCEHLAHWAQAHQIFAAENSKLVEQASVIALSSAGQRPRETHMRGIDEILADAQKVLAQSLQEAFDAGKAHTASELKRRMTAIFDDLISAAERMELSTLTSPCWQRE